MIRTLVSALVVALGLTTVGVVASAGPDERGPFAYPGEQPWTWDQPGSREQSARDPALVPVGKGALFVPAMSDPAVEPPYIVEQDGTIIDSFPIGSRAVLRPGIYKVIIGSGALTDRFERRVLVKEGRTTIVPATWSGLVVDVIDERGIPFRGSYEIVRMPERANIGLGLGADAELGEELRTWLLEPGTYMLIKTGESYRARRDFYTFRLQPGELLRLSLVMDRDDGSILGAGQVTSPEEETGIRNWRLHLVLGGEVEFNSRSDMVGFPSGHGFTLGGYLDFVAQYKPERHLVYSRIKFEQKQVKFPGQPFRKDLDELRFDALYVLRVLPWIGPYVRFGTLSPVFKSHVDLGDEREVVLVDSSGDRVRSLGTQSGMFELAKPFSPFELKGGAGIGFILAASYILDVNFRVGVGTRALFNHGMLSLSDDRNTPELEVVRRDDAFRWGVEATLVGSLRLTRWVVVTTEFEMLEPFEDYKNPVIHWNTNVGLRLVSFASLNYFFRMISDVERSDNLQTEHRLLLRFTWRIL